MTRKSFWDRLPVIRAGLLAGLIFTCMSMPSTAAPSVDCRVGTTTINMPDMHIWSQAVEIAGDLIIICDNRTREMLETTLALTYAEVDIAQDDVTLEITGKSGRRWSWSPRTPIFVHTDLPPGYSELFLPINVGLRMSSRNRSGPVLHSLIFTIDTDARTQNTSGEDHFWLQAR